MQHPRVAHATPLEISGLGMALVTAAWTTSRNDAASDCVTFLARVPWTATAAVLLLCGLVVIHYLSAAMALRAVSGERMPLAPAVLAQFAAAATNRIVPNGIGAAGVNMRFLLRNGLTLGAASSALAALGIVGLVTDLAYGAGVTTIGPAAGLPGAAHELRIMAVHGLQNGQKHYWLVLAVAVGVVAVFVRRTRGCLRASLTGTAKQAWRHTRQLMQQSGRVASAALASAITTVMLSVGFVVAVNVWGKSTHPLASGALLAIYLFASAAGGAVPLPPVFGLTEIALVGALVIGGYTSSSAILAVIVFRAICYWAPPPIGIWAARRLRRAALL